MSEAMRLKHERSVEVPGTQNATDSLTRALLTRAHARPQPTIQTHPINRQENKDT